MINWTPYFPQLYEQIPGQKQLMRGRTYLVPDFSDTVSCSRDGVENTMATGGLG